MIESSNSSSSAGEMQIHDKNQLLDVVREVSCKIPSGFFLRGLQTVVTVARQDGQTEITYDPGTRLLEAPKGTTVRAVRDATIYFLVSLLMGEDRSPQEWYQETVQGFERELDLHKKLDRNRSPYSEPWLREQEADARWALTLLKKHPIQLGIQYEQSKPLTFRSRDALLA
jgi:hypothetical protein